jgi:hypothetical protein
MKALLIIFLFISLEIQAQNILSLTYERSDNGFGLRYDRQINWSGFYIGGGYGMYNKASSGMWEHYKMQAGFTRYFRNYAEPDWLMFFSIGANGHRYIPQSKGTHEIEARALYPFSADIGVGCIICKRLLIGWDADFIKGDSVFKIGYRFGL